MHLRDLIFHAEYQLHRDRGFVPADAHAAAHAAALTIADKLEPASPLSSAIGVAQALHDLQAAGVSPDTIADVTGIYAPKPSQPHTEESTSRTLLTRTFGLDPATVDVTRSTCQIHDLLVDYTQALALAVPDTAADSLPGGRARLVNARGGTFLFAEEGDVQWDEHLVANPPAQPSPVRYVVIQERRYPYGPASTFPVSPDGRTGAAIEHGTVSDLVTNAKQRGDHVLEVGHEAMDQADLAVQTLRLAELYRAAQSGKQDDRSPDVKRFDDTMAGMLIESELRKHLANALDVLDVLAPRPWLIRPDRYEPDVTIVADAAGCCTCGNADLWPPADIEQLNLLSVRPNAWDPTQADVDLVLRAIDTTTDHGRPWTIEQVSSWLTAEMEAALGRHGWSEDDLIAVANSLPRAEPSAASAHAKPDVGRDEPHANLTGRWLFESVTPPTRGELSRWDQLSDYERAPWEAGADAMRKELAVRSLAAVDTRPTKPDVGALVERDGRVMRFTGDAWETLVPITRCELAELKADRAADAAQGFARIADLLLGPDRQAYTVDSIVAAVQQLQLAQASGATLRRPALYSTCQAIADAGLPVTLSAADAVKQLAAQRDENAAKYLALLADFDKLREQARRSEHTLAQTLDSVQRERDALAATIAAHKENEA